MRDFDSTLALRQHNDKLAKKYSYEPGYRLSSPRLDLRELPALHKKHNDAIERGKFPSLEEMQANVPAALEARRLAHAYQVDCDDCRSTGYPCATHQGACENCLSREHLSFDTFHRSKRSRSGRPLPEYYCAACDEKHAPPTTPTPAHPEAVGFNYAKALGSLRGRL